VETATFNETGAQRAHIAQHLAVASLPVKAASCLLPFFA